MATISFQSSRTPDEELPEMPIDAALIQAGQPSARGIILTQSEDRKFSSGLWTCEPGSFYWTFDWDESVYILEGEVEIKNIESGHAVVLKPGDSAYFPCGKKTYWKVNHKVKKFFAIRTNEPLSI